MSTTVGKLTRAKQSAGTSEDQRIAAELLVRIRESPYAAIRQLSCDFQEGVAILCGAVPTYHSRQIAISLAQGVAGVQMLDDRIQVSPERAKL
jgi:osmotically-inducible protein OsmY